MPDLWMGPNLFRFEQVVIERLVKPGQSGNYVLGFKDESGEFIPKYIGRSDVDLRLEMTAKLVTTKYPYFKFSLCNPRIAFEQSPPSSTITVGSCETRPTRSVLRARDSSASSAAYER